MFIVCEGIYCAGKSTIAHRLAESLDGVFYSTPTDEFKKTRVQVDANSPALDHYQFYLEGVRVASFDIENLLNMAKTVVCDRYWLSTYVYHKVMGVHVTPDDFSGIVMPDLSVLLTVSPTTQAKRFLERGMSAGDRRMINQQRALSLSFEEAFLFVKKKMVLNTDRSSPDDIVKQVMCKL